MKKIIKKIKYFLRNDIGSRNKLINIFMSEKFMKTLIDLKNKGVSFDVIYDIGARHAEWATRINLIFNQSTLYLFEANEKCITKLEESGFKFFITTLSSKVGTVDFYSNNSTGDSYYKENTSYYNGINSIKKETTTLDALITEREIPKPNFIKIDTQGSEIDILIGSVDCLNQASLVYLECPLFKYNIGAPDFSSYLQFMSSKNFYPYEISEFHYSGGILVQVDILFIELNLLNRINGTKISHLNF